MTVSTDAMYEKWPTGRMDVLWFVLANRRLVPHATFAGNHLDLSPIQPPDFEVPQHAVSQFFDCCRVGVAEWLRVTGLQFAGTTIDAHGLTSIRNRMRDAEQHLYNVDSSNQFYLCLARALGVDLRSARYARQEP